MTQPTTQPTTLWIDASAGASGDMLLGALLGAGVPRDVLQSAVSAVSPEPVTLRTETVLRAGLAATRCHVEVAESTQHRTWAQVRELLAGAALAEPVRALATACFARLAGAEAVVHGVHPDDVTFHEVGALDAIADVVGVCAGLRHLSGSCGPASGGAHGGPHDSVVVSPVAVGSGHVRGAHGVLPVPPPAVAELLRGSPSYAGPPVPGPHGELCTPTGAALLTTLATGWGPQPAMTTTAVGIGAGSRDPASHANVVRILLGSTGSSTGTGSGVTTDTQLLLETNVDDLDPRVWPSVLSALLAGGAVDAWLTPVLMKKGRPGHVLSVLSGAEHVETVRELVFTHTSTIGVRESSVARRALARELTDVLVGGRRIAVKLARLDGVVVSAQPEYDDVARVATALGRPVAEVLAEASAAAGEHRGRPAL